MVPDSHRQNFQDFQQALVSLQQQTMAAELNVGQLREDAQKVQQFFQQQIAPLSPDELEPAMAVRFSSLLTEMHKQMQLLLMDITFMQVSRQSATLQQRTVQMRDRLQTLLGYCEAFLSAE